VRRDTRRRQVLTSNSIKTPAVDKQTSSSCIQCGSVTSVEAPLGAAQRVTRASNIRNQAEIGGKMGGLSTMGSRKHTNRSSALGQLSIYKIQTPPESVLRASDRSSPSRCAGKRSGGMIGHLRRWAKSLSHTQSTVQIYQKSLKLPVACPLPNPARLSQRAG